MHYFFLNRIVMWTERINMAPFHLVDVSPHNATTHLNDMQGVNVFFS